MCGGYCATVCHVTVLVASSFALETGRVRSLTASYRKEGGGTRGVGRARRKTETVSVLLYFY